jgi:hypothetical protein
MKNRILLAFLKRKKLKKHQSPVYKKELSYEKNTLAQAKIIKLYPREIPAAKTAKIISMFN